MRVQSCRSARALKYIDIPPDLARTGRVCLFCRSITTRRRKAPHLTARFFPLMSDATSRVGGDDGGNEQKDSIWSSGQAFLFSLLSYVPITTVRLLLVIAAFQWLFAVTNKRPDRLDKFAISLSMMTALRSVFYEVCVDNGVDTSSAEVAAMIGAILVTFGFGIFLYCAKKAKSAAIVFCAMFFLFVIAQRRNPWPFWVSCLVIVVAVTCVCVRKHLHTWSFVIVMSMWYSAHLVYDISYFTNAEYTSMHDLVSDASATIEECANELWCVLRRVIWLVVTLLRCVYASWAWNRMERKRKAAELRRLQDNLTDINGGENEEKDPEHQNTQAKVPEDSNKHTDQREPDDSDDDSDGKGEKDEADLRSHISGAGNVDDGNGQHDEDEERDSGSEADSDDSSSSVRKK